MKVEVEFTTVARAELLALLRLRSRSVEDAVRFAIVYAEAAERQFVASEGFPVGVERVVRPTGDSWWWQYVNGVWFGYVIADRGTWPSKRIRRVRVAHCRETRPTVT